MKIRKTLTNIKRMDRLKATAIFLILQLMLIGMLCFHLIDSAPVDASGLSVVEGDVEDYRAIKGYGTRQHDKCYFYIDGEEYCIYASSKLRLNEMRDLLETKPHAILLIDNKSIASFSFNGTEYLTIGEYNDQLNEFRIIVAIIFLAIEILTIPVYVLFMIYHRTSKDPFIKRKKKNAGKSLLGRRVKVTVDRPIGSCHPEYPEMIYPINYGYIKGIMASDGEWQDAYIVGIDEPIESFVGRVIAIIHRKNDVEDKWVVAPEGVAFSEEKIREMTLFQEKYFKSIIVSNI